MATHKWTVTKDNAGDGHRLGTQGPSDAPDGSLAYSAPVRTLCDDETTPCYYATVESSRPVEEWTETEWFSFLDDLASPDAGCTTIEEKTSGLWKTV